MKNLVVIFMSLMIATGAIADLTPGELVEAFSNYEVEVDIESQFSTWDGSHRKLERYIKNQLNDSDSYQHIETRYNPDITPMQVATKFRAKNAYGALMINHVLAQVTDEGEVIRILKWY